jgi:hypothetical protein
MELDEDEFDIGTAHTAKMLREDVVDYDSDVPIIASMAVLRRIVKDCQYRVLAWDSGGIVLCDATSAQAIVLVYDAVNDDNKAKIERLVVESRDKFIRVAKICMIEVGL